MRRLRERVPEKPGMHVDRAQAPSPGREPKPEGYWTTVALIFAPPHSQAMRTLDRGGAYFEALTGGAWDLFFPGYFKSDRVEREERRYGSEPIGKRFAHDWYFNSGDFDTFSKDVSSKSGGRWKHTGETDLVVLPAWLPVRGEPDPTWASTMWGRVTDQEVGVTTLTLAEIVTRISNDLDTGDEDSSFGVPEVVNPRVRAESNPVRRELLVNALVSIATALSLRAL